MLLLVIAVLMIAVHGAKPTPATDQSTGSVENSVRADSSSESAKRSALADDSADSVKKPAGRQHVTFYLVGMNKRLKIL